MWFVLRGFGAQGFRKYIRRVSHCASALSSILSSSTHPDIIYFKCIELNQLFAELVENSPNLELVTAPNLALSVFRVVPKRASDETPALSVQMLNDLNRLFFGRLSARTDIMLTQTTLNGVYCVRLAVGAARTTEQHVRDAYEVIRKESELALESWGQTINGMLTVG